jgi:hypothetical protein
VTFGAGIVSDLSSLADDPSSIISSDYPSKSPVVASLDTDSVPVVVANALPVDRLPTAGDGPDTDSYISGLIRSSGKSWMRNAPGTKPTKGPFMLAAVSDTSRVNGAGGRESIARTRIGIVGSADLASNRYLDFYGNREFVTALVQWVGLENDLVSANREPGGFYKLVLTRNQKNGLIREGIVLPTLALLVPLPWAVLRLRRG